MNTLVCSCGDPHGVGPEVLLKSLAYCQPTGLLGRVVVAAPGGYLERLARDLRIELAWENVQILDLGDYPYPPPWGEISARAGETAARSLLEALNFCRTNGLRALVTPPVCKEALHSAGYRYPGQTELIGAQFEGGRPVMSFFTDRLKVILATTHLPLRDVPFRLDSANIVRCIELLGRALQRVGVEDPRLVLCGLNPHASEHGLFGDEERKILQPAVEAARAQGWRVDGPLPADTVFLRAWREEFDGVVALYHDQALIPVKLVAFEEAVNVTLGLPVLRTSPDHGTAFDLAGRGIADPTSMIAAVKWAFRLSRSAGDEV